jgi:hypothetical protein
MVTPEIVAPRAGATASRTELAANRMNNTLLQNIHATPSVPSRHKRRR